MLVHCAQGKDRTGILCALLQHAAGDDEAMLVADYALSERLLPARCTEPDKTSGSSAGVDWCKLRGSPPEQMIASLDWLRGRYGSIDGFLESSGCGNDWRQLLLRDGRPPRI